MSTLYQDSDAGLLKESGRNIVSIARGLGWDARWDTAKRVVTLRSPVQPSKMVRVPVTSINEDRVRSTVHQLTTYSDPERLQELVDQGVDLSKINAKAKPREYATTVAQAMADAHEVANPPVVWPKRTPMPDVKYGHWTELLYEDGHKEWVCDLVAEHKDHQPKTVYNLISVHGHNNRHRPITEAEKALMRANAAKARAAYAIKHGTKAKWDVKHEHDDIAQAEPPQDEIVYVDSVGPSEVVGPTPEEQAQMRDVRENWEPVEVVTTGDRIADAVRALETISTEIKGLRLRAEYAEGEAARWKRKAEEIEAEWDALRAMIGSK